MKHRRPEARICPLMGGPPHITCIATKCMMYEEVPNSSAGYCLLRGIGSLEQIGSELKHLSLSLDGLRQAVAQIQPTPRK
ncbi:hypothetical protein FJY68_05300 [candidate division WOR-3 bacterium]|uniref:Uncharacterized protein n=1 Tax=candidate division WOR-3 bacterium TaxID=2052148 RepID=A0A938BPK2_UNCW3|nr:hypothetical protein [candidate division WOR-3 bacterium]